MIKYIVLNGLPGSGRSTIAREITRVLVAHNSVTGVVQDAFSAPLRHLFSAALGEKFQSMNRGSQRPALNGYSLEWSLTRLEKYCRSVYGENCFGQWLAHRHLKYPYRLPSYVIVDDGAFTGDEEALPNKFIIHVIRSGLSMETWANCKSDYIFRNEGGIMQLYATVRAATKEIENAFSDT